MEKKEEEVKSNVPAVMAGHTVQRLNISGDQVVVAMKKLVQSKELTGPESDEIVWFYSWCNDNGLDINESADKLGKDRSTLWRIFAGKYDASYQPVIEEIMAFRKLQEERSLRPRLGFVKTSVWKKVDSVCRHALIAQKPVFIYGASQIGKTTCLEEFARQNNHGRTKFIRLPSAPTFSLVLYAIAKACYVSLANSSFEIREKIFDSLSDRNLIIIDEVHEVMIGCTPRTETNILEFLREIHDRCKCGMVFSGTKIAREGIERGRIAGILEQFRRRGIVTLNLPDRPPKSDLDLIASAFGLEPPSGAALDIINANITSTGLDWYISFLQSASNLAQKQKKPISWDHFVSAYDVIRNLSK